MKKIPVELIAKLVVLTVDLAVHVVQKVRKYKIFKRKGSQAEDPIDVPEVPGITEKESV